eukprot:TRINITY_DN937_c0_g1_i1.p3 TRINITY_DN937_c0_g1~~TRINITY_DN937_c0_g1_i1.p3  ORF type:complete len:125 (-),score=13.43 TRINITY_DN937_c0_g1_i1:135-509(-)
MEMKGSSQAKQKRKRRKRKRARNRASAPEEMEATGRFTVREENRLWTKLCCFHAGHAQLSFEMGPAPVLRAKSHLNEIQSRVNECRPESAINRIMRMLGHRHPQHLLFESRGEIDGRSGVRRPL